MSAPGQLMVTRHACDRLRVRAGVPGWSEEACRARLEEACARRRLEVPGLGDRELYSVRVGAKQVFALVVGGNVVTVLSAEMVGKNLFTGHWPGQETNE